MPLQPFDPSAGELASPLDAGLAPSSLPEPLRRDFRDLLDRYATREGVQELAGDLGQTFMIESLVERLGDRHKLATPLLDSLVAIGAATILPDDAIELDLDWEPPLPFSF